MRLVAIALVVCACKGPDTPPAQGSGTAAPTAAGSAEPASEPGIAKLPGELWFTVLGSPRGVMRVAGGTRWFAEGDLFAAGARLADGRIVTIASKGDGSPEQLVLVGPGAATRLGPAASQVRDPILTARGSTVVVALQEAGITNLHAIDVATGTTTQLTSDPQGNFRPASLGGDAIVFVSSRDGDAEIYRGSAKAGAVTRLTAFHKDDFDPTPSPDGKTIAFASDREGTPRIFLVNADGTNLRRLTSLPASDAREETEVAWSPDGGRIAYVMRQGTRSTLKVRELATATERDLTPDGMFDAEPAWSPDGAWIAVARAPAATPDDADIWAIPNGGGEAVRVTRTPGGERLPRWFASTR